jgi:signal transduction histidine kinase
MTGSKAGCTAAPRIRAGAASSRASPELRRVLANIRIIIAIIAAIECLSLSLAPRPLIVLTVLCYAAYAGWLCWVEINGSQPAQSPLMSWIDASWILLVAWLAGTPSSLFVLLLLFPVLFASLSFGFMSGLLVSLFAAVGALLVARGQQAGAISTEAMLFPLSLLGLGPLVAGLARAGVQMNEQVTIADRLLERADPRLGVARVADTILHALARHFEADLGLLLIWLPGCEPRLFRCDRSGTVSEVHGELRGGLLEALGRLPRDIASVLHVTHLFGRLPFRYRSGFHVTAHVATPAARPAMEILAELLDTQSLITVPICRRSPRPCWVLLDSAHRRYRSRNAELLFGIMEQVAPVIENAGLLEQLSAEAMATERARIGRDLHDTAIQPYLGIKYGIEALARKSGADNPLRHDILALEGMAISELHQLREVVSNMRSGSGPGEDTLAPALRRQGRRFSELFGLEVSVHCEGDISTNRKLAEACVHLVSEALTNIRRHTRATRAEIFVAAEPDTLVLRIGNDHGAEEPSPAAFVPRSIAERAESLHGCALVDLRRPGFTDLIISIPRT